MVMAGSDSNLSTPCTPYIPIIVFDRCFIACLCGVARKVIDVTVGVLSPNLASLTQVSHLAFGRVTINGISFKLSAVLNIVLPVFGVILAGVLSRKTGLLGADTSEALNKFVFYVALPPLLFLSFARVPVDDIFNWPFVNAYLLGTFLTVAVSVVCAWFFFAHRELPILTLHAMLSMFSNTVYLGIPLLILAYGPLGATPAIIVTLLSNLIFLTLAAVLIEIGQRAEANEGRGGAGGLSVLTSSLKNPLIIAPLLGTVYSALGLSLYVPVENFLDLLGRGAGATALFAMGMSLYGFSVSAGAVEIGWITFLKLVVHPLIAVSYTHLTLPTTPYV